MKRIMRMISGCMFAVLCAASVQAASFTDWGLLLNALKKKKASNEPIKLTDFSEVFIEGGKMIPQRQISLFEGFTIETPQINEAPAGFKGFEVTGKGMFGAARYPVSVKMTVVDRAALPAKPEEPKEDVVDKIEAPEKDGQDPAAAVKKPEAPQSKGPLMVGDYDLSFTIELPKNFEIAKVIPGLQDVKLLGKMTFPSGKFVASTYAYTDAALGIDVEKGLNFIAQVDAKGPFQAVASLKEKLGAVSKMIVLDGGEIIVQGVIADPLPSSSVGGTLPLKIGVDFTRISQIPKTFSNIIQSIGTNAFEFKIGADRVQAAASARIVIGGQQKPFTPVIGGTVWSPVGVPAKSGFKFFANLNQTLDLGYVALGNFGVQIEYDDKLSAVAAALGVPFTGVGLRGELMLGRPSDKRATIDMAGSLSLNSQNAPDILFYGEGKNLAIKDFVYFAAKQAIKGGLTVGKAVVAPKDMSAAQWTQVEAKAGNVLAAIAKMPTITIDDAKLYIAPIATEIDKKKYPAGFSGQFNAQLFGKTVGMAFQMAEDYQSFSYTGYLPVIKAGRVFSLDRSAKFKGQEILGSKDTGPTVEMSIDMKNPERSKFAGNAKIQLLDMSSEADLVLNKDGVQANAQFTIGGLFDIKLDNLIVDLTNPLKSRGGISIDQKIQDLVAQEVRKIASLDADTIQRDINSLEAKLKDAALQQKVAEYNQIVAFNQKAKQTRDTLNACWEQYKKNPLKVPDVCKTMFANVGDMIAKLPGLLQANADKTISSAVSEAYALANKFNKEINVLKGLQAASNSVRDFSAKAISEWLNIKSAKADLSLEVLEGTGKLPSFSVDMIVAEKSVRFDNVQLTRSDADAARKFVEDLGKKTFEALKNATAKK